MSNNTRFTYWIVLLPILAILLTSTILTYEFVTYEKEKLHAEKKELRTSYIEDIKNTTKSRVERTINLIETKIKLDYEEEKRNIKDIVNIGHKTINEIYSQSYNLPKEQIYKKIKNNLRNLRFYNNGSGYYFIIDLNNKVVMQPQTPSHEGKILTLLKDKNGKKIIQSFTQIAKEKGEGFETWFWSKPNTKTIRKKIGYIKLFEPLGIYIGSAKYEEDINQRIQNDVKELIDTIRFGTDEYMFAIAQDGTTISHINKNFVGKDISKQSKVERKIIKNILIKASKKGGSFLGYTPTSYNISEKLSEKISFVKNIPSLHWAIGTGLYTKKIEKQIKQKEEAIKKELEDTTQKIIIISLIITIILIVILAYIARNLKNRFNTYEFELGKNNLELKKLNETLESKVKKQVLKIREKDEMLNHQAKLASMGEMIGNIAHQWRQPLSTISTVASGTKLQDELKLLDNATMHENLDVIINNTQLLSQTIEDFRNFFKKDKQKVEFRINETINKVINLISATLKNKNIEIQTKLHETLIYNLENELTQAIFNIINNAKDALLEKNIENKIIIIETKELENKLHIIIKDNAGGIEPSVLEKIFEPYFTTKFKSQGTGIGLYMSRTIIVQNMSGDILARNEKFNYEGVEYSGAVFEIVLDKKD